MVSNGGRLPLFLVAAALCVALAAETVQLVDERGRLADLRVAQAQQMQQAVKFREQLQALGSETARLADDGDAAAKHVVDTLQQQGITLKAGGN
jgi:hypothetical protein